jgi:DNA polymerase theta
LHADGVLAGRNLVYCAPTSGGKSQVAEVLMLRRLHRTQRPFLLVLPYVALCSEKTAHLEKLLKPLGVRTSACLFAGHRPTILTSGPYKCLTYFSRAYCSKVFGGM